MRCLLDSWLASWLCVLFFSSRLFICLSYIQLLCGYYLFYFIFRRLGYILSRVSLCLCAIVSVHFFYIATILSRYRFFISNWTSTDAFEIHKQQMNEHETIWIIQNSKRKAKKEHHLHFNYHQFSVCVCDSFDLCCTVRNLVEHFE